MRRRCVLLSTLVSTVFSVTSTGWSAPARGGRTESVLPLTRVRIYETGIAYFEREGRVQAGASIALPLPAGHLDDALKTLVVLKREGDVEVSGIEFDTALTRAKAGAMLGLPEATGVPELDIVELARSLRGLQVEVALAGERVEGRLLGVVGVDPSTSTCNQVSSAEGAAPTNERSPCVPGPHGALTLMTAAGALRRVALRDLKSLKPVDPAAKKSVAAALKVLAGGSADATRSLHVKAKRGGAISLGYLSEAPLWRASYRLLLPEREGAPTLQAWALLHNDSDEDWRGLKIVLVNGRPDSYLFPLAGPRYAPRRLITPREPLPSVGQLTRKTVDDLYGDGLNDGIEGIGLGAIGTIGYGMGHGTLSGAHLAGGTGVEETDLLEVGDLAATASAEGAEKGSLFEYALADRVALGAHSSMLVPLVTRPLEVVRYVRFEAPAEVGQSVLSVSNTTDHTLPSGPLAVYADGGFAGESALSRLKPGHSQLLPFGTELDLSLAQVSERESSQIRQIYFRSEKLELHSVRQIDRVYRVTNAARHPKTALVRLGLVNNAKVTGAEVYYEADAEAAYAVLPSPAESSREVPFTTHEGVQRLLAVPDIDVRELRKFAKDPALGAGTRAALDAAAKALDQAHELKSRAARVRAGLSALHAESKRLQGVIKAIRGSDKESNSEWMRQLLELESRIRITAKELRRLERLDPWAPVNAALSKLPHPAPARGS